MQGRSQEFLLGGGVAALIYLSRQSLTHTYIHTLLLLFDISSNQWVG